MNKRGGTYRAFPRAPGLLLLAAVACANGCDEAAGDQDRGEDRRVYACTLAQGLVLGSLEVFSAPSATPTCRIAATELPDSSRSFCFPAPGNTSPGTCPDCLALKDGLQCTMMQ
ncbi:hypothetical protein [Polyangium sp. 15x6]|uniref:hypothetical protein n=1 Tax=Polyangium sp. 15x6 TaxID=3042687 RepID=UPI00249BD285|nr:hypothetical protein [Polyangium sp. 15x6]MDI3289000.1 hypothetical protein [Polyangium sp. 15x6]